MSPPDEHPASSTRVEAVHIAGAEGGRTTVVLEDGEEIVLGTDTFLGTGLSTGDPVDPALRATLVEAGVRWAIREAALRLLAHRARARRELERRLRRKEFPGGLVREVADELEARGYLDDRAFARSWIADRLRLRPRGRLALRAELRKKGVDRGVIDQALDEAFASEAVSERDIAVELARTWVRRQPDPLVAALLSREQSEAGQKARRRYQGFMARRGIRAGLSLDALDVLARARTADDGPESG